MILLLIVHSEWGRTIYKQRDIQRLGPNPVLLLLLLLLLLFPTELLWNHLHISLINKLRRVENCAAKLVTGTRKGDELTAISFILHLLSMRYRSLYNIRFYAHKTTNRTAPVYLSDLVQKRKPSETASIGV